MFFKVYRPILRRRLEKTEALVRKGEIPPVDDTTNGTFRVVELQGTAAA